SSAPSNVEIVTAVSVTVVTASSAEAYRVRQRMVHGVRPGPLPLPVTLVRISRFERAPGRTRRFRATFVTRHARRCRSLPPWLVTELVARDRPTDIGRVQVICVPATAGRARGPPPPRNRSPPASRTP